MVGSRGHGTLTNALLGSVSLGVLRHTTRPVLIVRGHTAKPLETRDAGRASPEPRIARPGRPRRRPGSCRRQALGSAHGERSRGSRGRAPLARGGGGARRVLARRELPLGRPDLPARQPAAARAADARAREGAAARALRHDARAEPDLRAHEPRDPRARPVRDLHRRAGPRRAGARRERVPRGHLLRDLLAGRAATRQGCGGSSGSSRSPAGSRATSRPRRPARSTRAASSATRSTHAYGAAFDNPDLLVCCVVGDGEAETGPLAGELALEQVPEREDRRRGAADPAPERLQDREPDRARPHPRGGAAVAASAATASSRSSSTAARAARRRSSCTSASRPRSTAASTRSRASRTRRASAA